MPPKTNEDYKELAINKLAQYLPDNHKVEEAYQALDSVVDQIVAEKDKELQKAREEERERIIYVTKNIKDAFMSPLTERRWLQCIQFTDQPKPKNQSELDQPNISDKD